MGNIRPVLIIVAGPNGSGKTTMTNILGAHEWLNGLEFINPDVIAQEVFGDWNDPNSVVKAAEEATRQRYACLDQHTSLAFETVFSSPEKLEFLQKAIDAGYFVRLFFVGTDNPGVNEMRIAMRVLSGGHTVPRRKIRARYLKSMMNLSKALKVCDRAYIYDNSIDGVPPELQYRTSAGSLKKVYSDKVRPWARAIMNGLDSDSVHSPDG